MVLIKMCSGIRIGIVAIWCDLNFPYLERSINIGFNVVLYLFQADEGFVETDLRRIEGRSRSEY